MVTQKEPLSLVIPVSILECLSLDPFTFVRNEFLSHLSHFFSQFLLLTIKPNST